MKSYIVGRILQAFLVLWGAYTVTHVILYLLPSDPLSLMLTASGVDADTLSPQQLAQARQHYGLDRGFVEQYFYLLGNLLQGDLGTSLATGTSVATLLAARLPEMLKLASLAVLLSIINGVGFAYLAGWWRWKPARVLLRRLPALGLSVPVFWTSLLFIQIFAFTLGWFPSMGNKGFASLILPAVTLAIPSAAIYAQVLLRGFDDVWREPYIITARAKGLSRGAIQWRHMFRNAALPILTLVGLQVRNTVSGAVLVETVFTRIGVGRLAEESVLRQDVPVALPSLLLALAIVTAIGFGTTSVAVAVGLGILPGFARTMRAEVMRVKTLPYVEAARLGGAGWGRVLINHILPNAAGAVVVLATLDFGVAILVASGLSFLGFGAAPPAAEWGTLIANGRKFLVTAPWLPLLPDLFVVLAVFSLNHISRTFEEKTQ